MGQPLADMRRRLILIGCGAMAGAMLQRWLDCGFDPALVTVVRPSGKPVATGVDVVTSVDALGDIKADMLLLGFKPQQLGGLAPELRPLIGPQTTILSILAAVEVAAIRSLFDAASVVRIMPNMPVRSGHGVVLLAGDKDKDADRLMRALGTIRWLDDETSFDLYTALTGSGPAFVHAFIDAMAAAAETLGMPPQDAATLSRAMIEGTIASTSGSSVTPAERINEVASKGGMTRAGLDVLDADGRLRALLTEMLRATRDRGTFLAEAARG